MITDVITLDGWRSVAPVLYAGGFLLFAFWEVISPRRETMVSSLVRWTNNFASFAFGSALLYLLLPTMTIGMAAVVEQEGLGLFNWLNLSGVWVVVLSVLLIDLLRYFEHCLLHAFPVLWRLHRMHHADLECDVATVLRAHPFEILFSALFRIATITVLGLPLGGVIIAEVLIVASNLFIHANIRMPLTLDRWLRTVIVTPDFHRVHHSAVFEEGNSNFANIFTFWDRLFGTVVEQPAAGHEGMTIGLHGFRDEKHMLLPWMLIHPFLIDEAEEDLPTVAPAAVVLDTDPGPTR